jgi:NitT/TauT family transport system substrate-binding protein
MSSACGDEPAGGGERTKLTVGLVPIHEVAPVHLGIEKGFFRSEGLDLEVQTVAAGADVISQVIGGDVQIGFSSTPSLFSAAQAGVPIEIVAPARGSGPAGRRDTESLEGAVMVKADSPIRSYADLDGKTVAVNALDNVVDLTLSATLDRRGVGSGAVERLEVPFPDMLAALDADRVDAAFMAPPFKTIAEQSGDYRSIGFPMHDVRPEFVFTSYFASSRWTRENEDLLERFLVALRRSMIYAAEHEHETRKTIGRFTELPQELVREVPIGNPRPDCKELEISAEVLTELMVSYGVLDREPDLDDLIRPGFCDD